MRNPWGNGKYSYDGGSDGYVELTAQEAYDSVYELISARVP